MRRYNGGFALCVATMAFPVFAFLSSPAMADAQCQSSFISQVPSPEGDWVAAISQVYCEDEMSSGVTEIVQVFRKGEAPQKAGEVLAIDDGADARERPILTWKADRVLQIEVPNLSLLGRIKNKYQDIDVILKYNPDDPLARAQFYKKLGISPP